LPGSRPDVRFRSKETKESGTAEVGTEPPPPEEKTTSPPTRARLGELLVEQGVLTSQQLDAALASQQSSELQLGSILVAQGLLDERGLTGALAAQWGVEVVDLRSITPTDAALECVDDVTVRDLRALPISIDDGRLTVATDRVMNATDLARLSSVAGMAVTWKLVPPAELTGAIDRSYHALDDVGTFVRAFQTAEAAREPEATPVETVAEDAPVVQVLTRLLTEGVREGASDIHIEPTSDAVRVRLRVDGALRESLILPASMAQALVSRIKIVSDMNIVERRRPQDGQFEFVADGRALDVRVSTVATIWGEKVVMRILDRSRSLLELAGLGMPEHTAEEFRRLVRSPFGMVICAGPTGSGKTTTLYAALAEIADPERNVTTIEDPVEYVFPAINQIQINEQAGITFAGGLKAILRQDPDVILVGEIRDVETARIAVQSALTGHLVLSSIHATDAALALQRLLDMGIESFLVASSVVAVVAQRLLRRICTHCIEQYVPPAEEIAFFHDCGGSDKDVFLRGAGCNLCSQSGYSGRVGVYELLSVSSEIRELIVKHSSHEKMHKHAVAEGMRTLRDEAIGLVERDVTTIGEVIRRIYVV
jgi:type IV pilus assembly protein PilB